MEVVHYEAADIGIQRHIDFVRRFVVAVEMDALYREACLQRCMQLAVGHDVQ
ncbi:hypothetical protein D3C80_1920870 [compost metagenome]